MLKYKIRRYAATAQDPAVITEAALNRRAINRILLVVTAGVLLLLFDLLIGFDAAAIPLLRSDEGAYLIRPAEGNTPGHIRLVADIHTDTGTVTKEYELSLEPFREERAGAASRSSDTDGSGGSMSAEELLAYEMRGVISSLNDDRSLRKVLLPARLRTGERITWASRKKSNTGLIALAMLLLVLFIYSRRREPIQKLQRAQMRSVRTQLPEFASRLALLLSAGLVLSAAFDRIVEDYRNEPEQAEDYFYRSMREIYNRIKETNGALEQEFRTFARNSECSCEGSRELIRISNILSDNISKGVALTDKLQSESEALWLSRKRDSEERGRIAETKLTMPLTVFLLVLVVVTVSPALLEL